MASEIAQKITALVRKLVGTTRILEKLATIEDDCRRHAQPKTIPPPENHFPLTGDTASTRYTVASTFLSGRGIEIGAFAYPLRLPAGAQVQYVDKYDLGALDGLHTIAGLTPGDFGIDMGSVIQPDIIDDGECLSKIGDYSQDFVIANHVLEHFENPVKGFRNMLRVLKHGGILYLSLPEMRHSFDSVRQPTPFEHILKDYTEGPAWSRAAAYAEFSRVFAAHGMDKGLFPRRTGAELAAFEQEIAAEMEQTGFSIHFHAWTADGMVEMFAKIKSTFNLSFETRMMLQNNDEVIFVFQKTVPHIPA
ncbi:MAG: class I SAM-dependent methyltransferase [Burkholderiaceae bacterium]|jgi:SAM-dependent methyltransferase|nr:class I SAM-dependent methyltransferase [Burkholderiaceae bacterium]